MRQQVNTSERQKANKTSSLLSSAENELVFNLLGRKCLSMYTAVAQIYKTEGSAHSHWKKKYTGVLCFVKDSSKRSYFMRLYCLVKNDLAWEHEIYDSVHINKPRSFLLTFEGQDGHVALNFASEEECDGYNRVVEMTIENRNRKRQERKNRSKMQATSAVPLNQATENDDLTKVTLRNHPDISSIQITSNTSSPQTRKGFSSTSKDKKRGKYRKEDISEPMNFIHISHVGWDADKGFDLIGNEEDEMLKFFFSKAGVSEQDLKDRATRDFIYSFVHTNNVLASVKSECVKKSKAPVRPPVPVRQQQSNGTQRTAPPPPPARQPPPPLPTATLPTRVTAPSRPPPMTTTSNAPSQAPPPPPPPPPPPQVDVIVPPPPQVDIAPPSPPSQTDTIPPPPSMPEPPTISAKPSLPVVSDSRSALMESIRKGATLRKVDSSSTANRESSCASNRISDSSGSDALADALRRALQLRGKVIHSSDEDSDESSDNDGEWED